jgi:hypothetical protein
MPSDFGSVRNGLISPTPNGLKSAILRVATVRSRTRAVAAGILQVTIGAAMHELRPAAKNRGIGAENVIGLGDIVQPLLDIFGFFNVLSAGYFNPGLNFAKSDCGYKERFLRDFFYPGQYPAMGFALAQLRAVEVQDVSRLEARTSSQGSGSCWSRHSHKFFRQRKVSCTTV